MMNSVLEMRNTPVNPEPRTTQHLVALYCGSRPGNNTIYREKQLNFPKAWHNMGLASFMAVPVSA